MHTMELIEGSCNDYDTKQSSKIHLVSLLPDSGGVTNLNNFWFTASDSSIKIINAKETGSLEDIFRRLTDVQFVSTDDQDCQATARAESEREFPCQLYKGESSGSKRKFDEIHIRKTRSEEMNELPGEVERTEHSKWCRRTRTTEMHNISEKKRRDRIRGKLKSLQELIPNCQNRDRASMLDEAIKYLKALKFQVEMISIGRGARCQAPCMLPAAGIPSIRIPHFSPFVPLIPSPGMGMVRMCCSVRLPMLSLSSAYVHPPSLSLSGRLNHTSPQGNLPVPHQVQLPFIFPKPLPAATARSTALPAYAEGFCTACNYPNQCGSSHTSPGCNVDYKL